MGAFADGDHGVVADQPADARDPSVVVGVLTEWGGVAPRAALVEATNRLAVDRALAAGHVTILRRG